MKTCCPHCETVLPLTEEQISLRNGMVRCGVCRQVFNAREHLLEDDFPVLDAEDNIPTLADTPASAPVVSAPVMNPVVAPIYTQEKPATVHIHVNQAAPRDYHDEPQLVVGHEQNPEDYYIGSFGTVRDQDEFSIERDSSYEEDYIPSRSRNSNGLLWFFLVLLALFLFVGQLMYVFRNQINHLIPSAHPVLVQMCGFLKCELGFQRSIKSLSLNNVLLSVDNSQTAQEGKQALRLQAVLKNSSDVPQQWPSLVLSLKNNANVISNRKIIDPKLYVLPEQIIQPFGAGQQIPINLPFVLTGAPVSNYELGLFYP